MAFFGNFALANRPPKPFFGRGGQACRIISDYMALPYPMAPPIAGWPTGKADRYNPFAPSPLRDFFATTGCSAIISTLFILKIFRHFPPVFFKSFCGIIEKFSERKIRISGYLEMKYSKARRGHFAVC